MADTPQNPIPGEAADSSANGARPLEELRHLILAPEQEALERLHQRIDDPGSRTEDVSTVVAEAIQRRRQLGGDNALSDALTPTIESALRESVRKDPGTLADALFPVMGPAIRRSILETLRSFLDSFNSILDQSLSWQGLQWRLEALRTGRTFTEVALLHSLVFRVEQVFLIHKQTGLSLGHAVAPAVAMQDPSLVSGMLSAIQDFVRDSFQSAGGQGIERMNVGDLDVWVEDGPQAILACVIRGVAPRGLRNTMAEVLEEIHRQYSVELGRFDGDARVFEGANKELARCLEFQQYRDEAKPQKRRGYVVAIASVLGLLLVGFLGWRWWQEHEWNRLVELVREQPGYVVTSAGREHGHFVMRGLKDPMAGDSEGLLKQANVNPGKAEFHWGSYYSLDDAMVQKRAVQLLKPPDGVQLTVKNGVLSATGNAPASWLKEASSRALLIPGIQALDPNGPFSSDGAEFRDLTKELQSTVIQFPVASAALSSVNRAKIKALVPQLNRLFALAGTLHRTVFVEVIGHTDSTGRDGENQDLSERRARRVHSELLQSGMADDDRLRAKGVGTAEPLRNEDSEENRQLNRSVTLRVVEEPKQ